MASLREKSIGIQKENLHDINKKKYDATHKIDKMMTD